MSDMLSGTMLPLMERNRTVVIIVGWDIKGFRYEKLRVHAEFQSILRGICLLILNAEFASGVSNGVGIMLCTK
jgi:hypothetical protein